MVVGQILGVEDLPTEDVHSCQDVAFCGLGDGVVVPYQSPTSIPHCAWLQFFSPLFLLSQALKGSLLGDNQIGEEKEVAQRGGVGESHPA